MASLLFNVYIHHLPVKTYSKYGYADDLAILLSKPSWEVEECLPEDLS